MAARTFPEVEASALFHNVVLQRFRGPLKEPFRKEYRDGANLPEDWYRPLVNREAVEAELKERKAWVAV